MNERFIHRGCDPALNDASSTVAHPLNGSISAWFRNLENRPVLSRA